MSQLTSTPTTHPMKLMQLVGECNVRIVPGLVATILSMTY
jgi:hypothetical protein